MQTEGWYVSLWIERSGLELWPDRVPLSGQDRTAKRYLRIVGATLDNAGVRGVPDVGEPVRID